MGKANVYSILPAKKLRQSIDVLDLTGIAHVPAVWTLGEFVPLVGQSDVRAIPFE